MTDLAPRPGSRRTDLDLLRVVACFAIIVAHATLIFTSEPRYHVKSASPHLLPTVIYEAFRIGTIPLFFALAGWGSVVALRRRSGARFLRDRAERILLPLVAGILLLGPIIRFIELQQGRNIGLGGWRLVDPLTTGLLEFLPRYWGRLNLLTWSHLWFLAYLFIISVVLLPLLQHLARQVVSMRMPGRMLAFLPAPALAVVAVAGDAYWPNLSNLVQDWGSLVFYAACVALGAWLAAWPGLEGRLRQDAPLFLALAALGFALMVAAPDSVTGRIGVGLCAWGAIGASFGYAGRHPPAASRALSWLGGSTMAVYVLHHVPLLLIAAALLPLAMPGAAAWAIIVVATTAITLAAYRWLVEPFAAPRLLVGMPRRKA
ncbi:acyltransferase family protein [Falsiroseomonas sp. HW251]|uniref:acyltransferase family protein n=1 Tax=Falsiroseomonas sp. HW251 TaxID=3390998 RepID=UPI003D31B3A6